MNDLSALTDELKLGGDNSDSIKVHPELNCVFSPQPCVRVLAIKIFRKISVASTRRHLLFDIMTAKVQCWIFVDFTS